MSDDVTEHVVRLRDDATGWRQVDGPRLTPDDPFLDGLDEDEAENLVRSNWALRRSDVNEAEAFYPAESEEDATDEGEQDAASDGDEKAAVDDVESWDGWNEEDWLDLDYQQRATDVREGRVDDHLHDIKEVETSETVIDAVDERLGEVTDGVHSNADQEE